MNKAPLLAVIVIMATVASAGCLDIEWVRDNIIPVPEPVVDYVNLYTNISHSFDSDPDNFDTLVYNQVADVEVPIDSDWIDVRVTTVFDDLPEDFPIDLKDLQERLDIDRTVTVTLFTPSPDNKVYLTETYVESTHLLVQWDKVSSPENGTWRISVESEGMGSDAFGYQDSFSVQVIVRAPNTALQQD